MCKRLHSAIVFVRDFPHLCAGMSPARRDRMVRPLATLLGLLVFTFAANAAAAEGAPPSVPHTRGDLFPGAGRPTVAAATGLPFLGIAEAGIGITNGIAVGVVGGITPSVWTVGVRPRFRLATSERTALVLSSPILFYPKASAPGPGNVGSTSWLLTRTELFFDGALGDRWHLAGGMGVIAAAATEALGQALSGRELAMPPYAGSPEPRRGFAGGIWNTVAVRSSVALNEQSHLFAEGSLVMEGLALASNVGGPPIVVNAGVQHTF